MSSICNVKTKFSSLWVYQIRTRWVIFTNLKWPQKFITLHKKVFEQADVSTRERDDFGFAFRLFRAIFGRHLVVGLRLRCVDCRRFSVEKRNSRNRIRRYLLACRCCRRRSRFEVTQLIFNTFIARVLKVLILYYIVVFLLLCM